MEKKSEELPIIIDEPIQTYDLRDEGLIVSANKPITVSTEGGYFKTNNKNIKIQKRDRTNIVFTIPFGIQEVKIETIEKGDIVEKTYRVV